MAPKKKAAPKKTTKTTKKKEWKSSDAKLKTLSAGDRHFVELEFKTAWERDEFVKAVLSDSRIYVEKL